MIKASRRDIFRGMFGRAGFELSLETAHEILMRLNRSLDPIPVSAPMWQSHATNRRPLKYTDFSARRGTDPVEILREVDEAGAQASFAQFPDFVAADLRLLLRIEILLRLWTSTATADLEPADAERRRGGIAGVLEAELLSYLSPPDTEEEAARQLAKETVQYLVKQARG